MGDIGRNRVPRNPQHGGKITVMGSWVKVAEVTPPAAAVALKLDGPFGHSGAWKWIGRCPACAAEGKDTEGNHLVVYKNGAFGCATLWGDAGAEHRRQMAKLCPPLRGAPGTYVEPEFVRVDMTAERDALKAAALVLFDVIQEEYSGEIADLGPSAEILEDPRWQFGKFCDLYQPADIIWAGNRKDSPPILIDKKTGEMRETPDFLIFSNHLFVAGDEAERDRIFALSRKHPMDLGRGNSWKPGSIRRLGSNAAAVRFTNLEHDGVEKPAQIALARYAAEVLNWDLRMVVDTTNRGYHFLFDVSDISPVTVRANIQLLTDMGADPMALNEAACRVPGLIRQRVKPKPGKPEKPYGGIQRIVWLKP